MVNLLGIVNSAIRSDSAVGGCPGMVSHGPGNREAVDGVPLTIWE